ncbi:MAG: hypothetical protein OEU26_37445 [Candidatus Tectomicrobia bacterium]|nr:hypothetical protein [Candidatus Tectomicrobia bacterium]
MPPTIIRNGGHPQWRPERQPEVSNNHRHALDGHLDIQKRYSRRLFRSRASDTPPNAP